MDPFLDSTPIAGNASELRERAERDGYLFFRGLVPPAPLLAVRRQILEICERHGWLKPGTAVEDGMAAPGVAYTPRNPEYLGVYDEIQRLESFHALPHQPALLSSLRSLFGEEVLVHPRNIARVMFPQNTKFTTPAHQDYIHIKGSPNTWTAWIPLSDCPEELGGLAVLAGSHTVGILPTHAAYGAGGAGVDTDDLPFHWVLSDYRCGDVMLFHSHAVHRGMDNLTRDRLRVSVDYRYQPVSEPVAEDSLLPHHNRANWDEIYAGWARPELQYYWKRLNLNVVGPRRETTASY